MELTMSKTSIPQRIQNILWAKSAGRCEFPGCNKILYRDELTKSEYNSSLIAHIIADSPKGPRGEQGLSEKLAQEIENLMLLCHEHHRLIDGEHQESYPVTKLQDFKKRHEDRIERLTEISEDHKTVVVLYGANVGMQSAPLTAEKAYIAISENDYYPASSEPIEMSLKNSVIQDHLNEYWMIEKRNLEELFNQKLKFQIKDGHINHLSIFGFAPQPLLIYLGYLLSDIQAAELYQLHRSPPNWIWKELSMDEKCHVIKSEQTGSDIALAVSMSQSVESRKIQEVLGNDTPIWTIAVNEPNSEYLKTKHQLTDFRVTYKKVLSEIKLINGDKARIHLFPASPIPVAIEMGRARFPKVDLPMTIYDYNKVRGGFIKAIEIE